MSYHPQAKLLGFLSELNARRWDRKYFFYRLKWNYFPQFRILPLFPLHIDLELTSRCNMSCEMCIRTKIPSPAADMSFELAESVLTSLGPLVPSVKMNWRGEPLLYSRIVELVRTAKRSGFIDVQFNTNGSLLTDELVDSLIDAGLDRIIFSFDGMSPYVYERIRRGGKLVELLNSIHKFIIAKNKKQKKFPLIRIQMCKGPLNKNEVETFQTYWKKYNVNIALLDRQDRKGVPSSGGEIVLKERKKVECYQPWQRLTISNDGRIFACCADWYETKPLGKIVSTKPDNILRLVDKVWNGKEISYIRDALLNKRLLLKYPCSICHKVVNNG